MRIRLRRRGRTLDDYLRRYSGQKRRVPLLRLVALLALLAVTGCAIVVAVAAISETSFAKIIEYAWKGLYEYFRWNYEGLKEYLAFLLDCLKELV